MAEQLMNTPDQARAEALADDPRVVAAAMRAFFAVADRWELTAEQARRLLGAPAERTYYSWKREGVERISPDALMRISYVLGIAALLERLFAGAPERAQGWMRRPNTSPLTAGRSALDFVLDGGLVALDELRSWLQTDAGGGAPVATGRLVSARR
jgi:hypothetical protein